MKLHRQAFFVEFGGQAEGDERPGCAGGCNAQRGAVIVQGRRAKRAACQPDLTGPGAVDHCAVFTDQMEVGFIAPALDGMAIDPGRIAVFDPEPRRDFAAVIKPSGEKDQVARGQCNLRGWVGAPPLHRLPHAGHACVSAVADLRPHQLVRGRQSERGGHALSVEGRRAPAAAEGQHCLLSGVQEMAFLPLPLPPASTPRSLPPATSFNVPSFVSSGLVQICLAFFTIRPCDFEILRCKDSIGNS